jgi:hypothetical protein
MSAIDAFVTHTVTNASVPAGTGPWAPPLPSPLFDPSGVGA